MKFSIRQTGAMGGIRMRRAWRGCGFVRDASGIAAITFAFCLWPFLLFMFMIIEVAVLFFITAEVEHTAGETARDIRLGEYAATPGLSPEEQQAAYQAQFVDDFCSRSVALFECRTRLQVDVRTFPDFASAAAAAPVNVQPVGGGDEGDAGDSGGGSAGDGGDDEGDDSGGGGVPCAPDNPNPQFCPGGEGAIVLVRAFYQWPAFTPALSVVNNVAMQERVLSATAVFRNEGFDFTDPVTPPTGA